MAKNIEITTYENVAKIVVDGNEIHDVMSYALSEDENGPVLNLSISIMGAVEVQR